LEEYMPDDERRQVAQYPHYFLGSIIISRRDALFEGKDFDPTSASLSVHNLVSRFEDIAELAYNLGNFLRWLALSEGVKDWSLRSVQVKMIKIGGRLVLHTRRLVFQLAEVAVPQALFQGVLDRIGRLYLTPG
jgi:hypothetical protein